VAKYEHESLVGSEVVERMGLKKRGGKEEGITAEP